jgi:hypothetical protein
MLLNIKTGATGDSATILRASWCISLPPLQLELKRPGEQIPYDP